MNPMFLMSLSFNAASKCIQKISQSIRHIAIILPKFNRFCIFRDTLWKSSVYVCGFIQPLINKLARPWPLYRETASLSDYEAVLVFSQFNKGLKWALVSEHLLMLYKTRHTHMLGTHTDYFVPETNDSIFMIHFFSLASSPSIFCLPLLLPLNLIQSVKSAWEL